jgi:hypothetical protein
LIALISGMAAAAAPRPFLRLLRSGGWTLGICFSLSDL